MPANLHTTLLDRPVLHCKGDRIEKESQSVVEKRQRVLQFWDEFFPLTGPPCLLMDNAKVWASKKVLQQLANFLVEYKYGQKKKFYSHLTVAVYFNECVVQVRNFILILLSKYT